MKFFLTADTHLNAANIATYCDRPANFTDIILKRWNERVRPEDTVIHLGDVAIGKKEHIKPQLALLNGRKILIRGNHDWHSSLSWWTDNGMDFACDGMVFRGCWLTHHPAHKLPYGCNINIHGHLHNIWDGFHPNKGKCAPGCSQSPKSLQFPWQRLFAIEYSNYYPIEFDSFVDHPDRFQARGPKEKT
jgi:calcineurin-like phosphoesterase family protein